MNGSIDCEEDSGSTLGGKEPFSSSRHRGMRRGEEGGLVTQLLARCSAPCSVL